MRIRWATFGFVLVTLVVLWLVSGRGQPWRSAEPSPGSSERAHEPPASPDLAPKAAERQVPDGSSHPSARRLRVRVVTPAGPLEGAELRIDGEEVLTVTGADGVGEIGTDDLDVVWVRASKQGFREVETGFPGGVDEGEIVLVPGVPLRGIVVRAKDGAPVAGAEVRAAERATGDDVCRVLKAGEDGRFTVPGVAAGTHFVVAATFQGFAPASTLGVAGSEATEIRVVLGAGATLAGTVRGGDGQSAEGVAIRVFPADDDYLARSHDASIMEQTRLRAAARSTTDALGRYAIEGIAPGDHVVLALGASGASARSSFAVTAPGEAVRVDLTLEPTGSILVRVLDPDGRPVRGAPLSIHDAAAKWLYGPRIAERTDDKGEGLATGLEPGVHDILVHPARWAAARARVVVERGPPVEVQLRVQPGASIEGTVRDPAGQPVPGIEVSFEAPGEARIWASRGVVTGRDGRFVIEGLEARPGMLRVNDWAERWSPTTVDKAVPGDAPLAIVVRPAAAVSGRFEPPPASRRVAYTVVTGDSTRGRWELDLDPGGRFVLTGVDEGEPFTVYFDVPGACLMRCPVAPLAPGEQRDLGTLVVAPGRALRGHATDQDGKPWAFTRIELSYDDFGIEMYTLTDENGRFAFENVDPAAPVAITVWNAERTGESFDFEDWTAVPVHALVVARAPGR